MIVGLKAGVNSTMLSEKDWEKKYFSIIEEIEDGYVENDLRGNHTYINKALCKILGYSKEEVIGTSFRKFMSEEQIRRNTQLYTQVFKTGRPSRSYVLRPFERMANRGYWMDRCPTY